MDIIKKLKWKAVQTREAVIEPEEEDDGLETPDEKRRRWRSVRVIYFTMFLMSLGFSVVLTAVWPFLDKLDPKAGKEFMGYVVAANPLGEMIFSPVIGYWVNKRGSIRVPLICTLILFVLSSGVYSGLEVIEEHKKYWMLCSRFVVGASSANLAAARSYLSSATRIKERTGAISINSLAQVLGFVIGPIIQAAVTPLGERGLPIIGELRLNMFTATGWINVTLGIFNIIMFLPFCFTEYQIATKEVMKFQGKKTEKETWKMVKPDYFASWSLIVAYFIIVFNFVLLETLGTSLTMDQFAWTKTQSLYYVGILMAAGAIIACVVFAFIPLMTKIFDERKLMLWGGFFTLTIASVLLIPWGTDPPKLAIPQNLTYDDIVNISSTPEFSGLSIEEVVFNLTQEGEELVGCPLSQEWCTYTSALILAQLCLAYAFASIGYPLGTALLQTIFSKILGTRPQGVWMGLLSGSGCFSRVMGPVFVGYVYSIFGPVWTFTTTTIIMLVSMAWIQLVSERLKPPALCEKPCIELQSLKVSIPQENGNSIPR